MPHVLAVIDDLFFIGKLAGTAKQVGVTLQTTPRPTFQLMRCAARSPRSPRFSLLQGAPLGAHRAIRNYKSQITNQ
jgi:hypothetical protein